MSTIINGKEVGHLLIGNRDARTSEAVWIPPSAGGGAAEREMFLEEIEASQTGKKFLAKYDLIVNFPTISQTIDLLYPDRPYITTGIFLDALKTLLVGASDKLIPRETIPAAVAPATPPAVDRNGRVLGSSQKAWQEHAEWSKTASSRDIAERRRVDPSFAKFYASSLQIEMTREIDGDVRPFNPHMTAPTPSKADVQGVAAKAGLLVPELKEWVKIYHQTPASQVRLLRSPGANPTGFEAYNKAFDAACAANLI